MAEPLKRLLIITKRIQFMWAPEEAFPSVKRAFTQTLILCYPKAVGQLILDTDASAFLISWVLSKIQDGVEVPLSFASSLIKCSGIIARQTRGWWLLACAQSGGWWLLACAQSGGRWLMACAQSGGWWLLVCAQSGVDGYWCVHKVGADGYWHVQKVGVDGYWHVHKVGIDGYWRVH